MKINFNAKYPCMANWVMLKKTKYGSFIVRNGILNKEAVLSAEEAYYLSQLDGTRGKYDVEGYTREEARKIYRLLCDLDLLRNPGRRTSIGFMSLITIYIPSSSRAKTVIPRIFNWVLLSSFLPVFGYALYENMRHGFYIQDEYPLINIIVACIILAASVFLHEISHVMAVLSDRRGRFFEAGLMRKGIFPGAYILADSHLIKNRFARLQVHLAGIEMNLLIAGLSLIVARFGYVNSYLSMIRPAFYYAAALNMLLAFTNLSFSSGMDGEHGINELMGGDIFKGAINNLIYNMNSGNRKYYFMWHGMNGIANIAASIVVLIFQLFIPMLILWDIVVVIGGMFG